MLDIFEPVFEEIDNLIRQQVNGVRIKRLADQHPEGAAIKVRCANFLENAIVILQRQYFWLAALVKVNTSRVPSLIHTPTSK